MLKKMPGLDKSKEDSRSITTIQGRGGKEKTPNSNGAQVRDLISEIKESGSQIDINDIVSLRGLLPTPPQPTLLSMAHHRTQPGSSTDPGLIKKKKKLQPSFHVTGRYSGYPGSAGQGNYGQWGYPGYPPSSS